MPYTTLVSTERLASHLHGSWAVVDCRYDLRNESWGRDEYLAAHVPGAVYVSLSRDLSDRPNGSNGRHPLPPVGAIAAAFGRLGIGTGTQVVAYDQDSGMFASRLWWMLRYLGHDAAAVLDGGWAKWLREGRETRSGDEHRSAALFDAHVRPELIANLDDVEALAGNPSTLLVDARAPERYEGSTEPLDRLPGHIPGAVNHFYRNNVGDEGTMLPATALRADFERLLGNIPPDDLVVYCGSGVSACHNLLAMEHAGLTGARLYPGSWSEWSSNAKRPVETGPSRPR